MTKAIVIVGFLVAFAAGLIVGIETRHTSIAAPTTRARMSVVPAGGYGTIHLTDLEG